MNIDPLVSSHSQAKTQAKKGLPTQNNQEHGTGVNKTFADSADNTSIRAPSVHEARKLLNDKIIAALDKTLTQANQTSIYELDPADFTPDKVANRILSFIGAAFSNIASDDKTGQMERLEQARKGVEKGFNDAKEILEGLGVFKEGIADTANKTYDLLQTGLDKIAANIEAGTAPLEGLFNTANEELSVEKSSFLKQSFDFELTTKDGDKVTINVNRVDASNDTAYIKNSDNEKTTSLSSSHISQSGYSISVQGQLDEDEVQAIDKLLGSLTEVANKYFENDTQSALDQLSQLGYDTSEIASFSLNLKEVQQTKATAIYQQLGGSENNNPSSTQFSQMIKPLQEYAAQLTESHNQFMESNLFNNNNDQFQQLLNQITDMNHIFPDKNKLSQFNALNSTLLT